MRQLGEQQRGERRELRRLQHHRVPCRECRRHLPRQHEQGEVPRNDLPHHAHRPVARELLLEQLRPPGVVIEVPRHERNVQVARLADALAVVHRLDDGEQARMLLHHARERVEVLGPLVAAQLAPAALRLARGGHGGIHVLRAALRDLGEQVRRARIDDVEGAAGLRPRPVHEVAELGTVLLEPGARLGVTLRRRAVVHRLEDLGDCRHQGIGWRWAAA